MKCSILLVVLFNLICTTQAFAGHEGGGGDPCEDRIKIVRDNLREWIFNGGPEGLKLPKNATVSQYSFAMLKQIDKAKIRCVSEGDEGFPVNVEGTAKVCRFDSDVLETQITCDFKKFQATDESDQYVLIHHEFAGLAKMEIPNGADSDYSISNQISGYLVNKIVKKLSIRPALDQELIFETFATALVATDFCHADTEAAKEKAKNLCKQKGYRRDECSITVERIDSERIHEYAGEYSQGGAMYYKMSCTSKATIRVTPTLKFEFGPFESLVPVDGSYITGLMSFFGELNQAIDLKENVFISLRQADNREIGDFGYYSAVVFSMTLPPQTNRKVIKINKICVDKDFTRYLDQIKGIANGHFSFNLNYSKSSNIFACGFDKVAVTGTIAINEVDASRKR
jgi:hypothetical protein